MRSFLTFSGSVAIARKGVTFRGSTCMASALALISAMVGDEKPESWDDEEDDDWFC